MSCGAAEVAGDTARTATSSELTDLRRETRALKEVVAEQALELRHAYFRWQGDQPATVQFIRRSGWHLGRVLGVRNQPVPYDLLEEIRRAAEPLLGGVGDDVEEAEDGSATKIDALCERARRTFSVAESEPLAEELRRIQGKTLGHGVDTNAYCVFDAHLGFVQFLASVDGHEYLCEIQSHRYDAAVEEKLAASFSRPATSHSKPAGLRSEFPNEISILKEAYQIPKSSALERMGLGERQTPPDAAKPVNRSNSECPRLLGFRAPRRHRRDCYIGGEWRRKGTRSRTVSAPRRPTSTACWSR